MSFVTNPAQQMTFDDSIYHLTDRERKSLENSWAKLFEEEIFPMIDEEPYWSSQIPSKIGITTYKEESP